LHFKKLRFSAILAQYRRKLVTGHQNIVSRFFALNHIIIDISRLWTIMHSGIGDTLCLYEHKEAASEPIF